VESLRLKYQLLDFKNHNRTVFKEAKYLIKEVIGKVVNRIQLQGICKAVNRIHLQGKYKVVNNIQLQGMMVYKGVKVNYLRIYFLKIDILKTLIVDQVIILYLKLKIINLFNLIYRIIN